MTAMLPALAGSSIIYGMGLLDMGIVFSYAQMLIDRDFVRMVRKVMRGIAVNRETLAKEVIMSVGAGGNYLGEKHTRAHMRGEQSCPALINRRSAETWESLGSKTMLMSAEEEALKILETYEPDRLPDDVSAKLRQMIKAAEDELCGHSKFK